MQALLEGIRTGDFRSLARAITRVENELPGYDALLKELPHGHPPPVIGFTGPPGSGKSTLVGALAGRLAAAGGSVAVVAVDPTSPFSDGSLLADRLRMADRFTDPRIFIRSVATRGSLGGLSEKMIEITDVLKAAPFSVVLVETVGVGQSEVEIAGLADTTVVVLVPESGDEIQALKSGIMEIADIFVVNKCDREGADRLVAGLEQAMALHAAGRPLPPVVKTSAVKEEGLERLMECLRAATSDSHSLDKRAALLAEKLYRLIARRRMRGVRRGDLAARIRTALEAGETPNIYRLAEEAGV